MASKPSSPLPKTTTQTITGEQQPISELSIPRNQPTTISNSSQSVGTNAKMLQEITEKVDLIPASLTSGAPDELLVDRKVRIYRPCRNAMQSGDNETRYWQIDFDNLEKWENPMIGYVSSADSQQALRLRFHEKSEAILFAEKQGWDYIVQEEQNPSVDAKSYSNNFKYVPGKLRYIQTK